MALACPRRPARRPATLAPARSSTLAQARWQPARQPPRADSLVVQLPVGMLDDDFFYRFASIFQEEASSFLDVVDNLAHIIDPAVAPPAMVRFLAGWLALPPLPPSLDEAYQRRYVKEARGWRAWRGTRRGLTELLRFLTGGEVEVADSGGVFRQGEAGLRPAQVRVTVEGTGWLTEADFIELVRDEVPANATLELFIGQRRAWPKESEQPNAN